MPKNKDLFPPAVDHPGPISSRTAAADCACLQDAVHNFVDRTCESLVNSMDHDHNTGCPCTGVPGSGSKVDLIVLIDSSGSMGGAAAEIAKAAKVAIDAARKKCKVDELRVNWLTVDNSDTGSGTVPAAFKPTFTHTHQAYLVSISAPGPFQQDDTIGHSLGEEGADAIKDLATFYNWRDGACRAIFYVSDTNLEGYNTQPLAVQQAAVDRAVQACQASSVAVFSHFADPRQGLGASTADVEQTYTTLSSQTGGATELGGVPNSAKYAALLEQAICQACGTCRPVKWPDVNPCVSVVWGDAKCDHIGSDDHEKICITLCNCYSNVTFGNVSIAYLWLVDEHGHPPPQLPDGSPSSRVYPVGPLCFGDLGPCTEEGPTCVSQEAIVINCGAKPGKYQLLVGGLCFSISHHQIVPRQVFEFEICAT